MNISLEDNCVRYCLYSDKIHADREQSEPYLNQLLATVSAHVLAYKWNYVPFHLRFVPSSQSHNQIEHFEGISNFDENIEDEWFIVYLLFELSRQYDSLVIQVQDTDGEFLLIQAAEQLPRWVKPESVENRHFIHRGKLHLINRSDWPGKILNNETQKAIEFIRSNYQTTVCSDAVQQQIQKRIGEYPEKIAKLTHKARVRVPVKVAALLDSRPQLISHAVRAFCSRDEQDLLFCRRMENFSPTGMVQMNVRMTKFNYAQLCSQELKPDKRLDWPLPDSKNSTDQKACDLGFKLSCGFEILLCSFEQKQMIAEQTKTYDLTMDLALLDKRWQTFLQSLKTSGYFEDLLENSKAYVHKLKEAKTYFTDIFNTEGNENEEAFFDPDFLAGKTIHELIKSLEINAESFQSEESQLSDEESDEWLYEPPEYFCEMENESKKHVLNNTIPEKLEEFIVKKSDHKGAVFPKEKQSLKERAMNMISDNLRSILAMKVSDSEQDDSESDLSDYQNSSDDVEMDEDVPQSVDNQKKTDKASKETKKHIENDIKGQLKETENDPIATIKELMQQMDQELSTTCMAQSFDRTPKAPLANKLEEFGDSDEECSVRATDGGSERDLGDDLSEVDVRFNAVKNILESFRSQNGLAGPSSNILSSMGVHLPRDSSDS